MSRSEKASGHTPGPWLSLVTGFGETNYLVCRDAPGRIHPVCAMEHGCPNAEANAHLIAAAPSMAETLERIADDSNDSRFNLMRYAEEDDTDYFLRCIKAIKDEARAALRLANTGKEEG